MIWYGMKCCAHRETEDGTENETAEGQEIWAWDYVDGKGIGNESNEKEE